MKLRELRVSYHRRDVPDVPLQARSPITQPHQAAALAHALIGHEAVEVFGMLLLDIRNQLVAWHEVTRGTLNETLIHPRDVVKAAVLANAASVIVVHNHPSGNPTPSPEDMQILSRLQQALGVMGIPLYDFLVVGESPTRFYSYRAAVR